jgi:hypothetical protein
MEDFETNLAAVESVGGELMELLPDEPTTELEAKCLQFLGLVEQLMALLIAMDVVDEQEVEDVQDDAEELLEEEAV